MSGSLFLIVACFSNALFGGAVGLAFGHWSGRRAGYDAGVWHGRLEAGPAADPPRPQVGQVDVGCGVAVDVDGEGRITSLYTDGGGVDLRDMDRRARAQLGRLITDSNDPAPRNDQRLVKAIDRLARALATRNGGPSSTGFVSLAPEPAASQQATGAQASAQPTKPDVEAAIATWPSLPDGCAWSASPIDSGGAMLSLGGKDLWRLCVDRRGRLSTQGFPLLLQLPGGR